MQNVSENQAPVLVHEDKGKLDHFLTLGRSCLRKVEEVAKAYNALDIGRFDNAAYQGLIHGGLTSIEDRIIEETNTAFESLKLRSESLRNEALTGAYDLFNKLKAAVGDLRRAAKPGVGAIYGDIFPLMLITISEEGRAEITAGAEEELREKCRVYLCNTAEEELYRKLQVAAEAIMAVQEELAKHRTPLPFIAFGSPILAVLKNALSEQESLLRPNVEYVKWAMTAGNTMEEMKREYGNY